jgi:hypothetical protein
MSAALVSQTTQQHVLKDDLESSIYVLLWVALMCSETSNPDQAVLFLKTVLDQQPFGGLGSYQKADFLKGRTFLNLVKFVDRPALDELINQLACIFGSRYVTPPSDEERRDVAVVRNLVSDDPMRSDLYLNMPASIFDVRFSKLEDHEAIIELFDAALSNPDWPPNDPPVKRDFEAIELQAIIKSGWRTSLFVVPKPE